MKNKFIVFNGIVLGLFLALGMTLLMMRFSPQYRPIGISILFYTPVPILVAVVIYLTVVGIRKVMDGE